MGGSDQPAATGRPRLSGLVRSGRSAAHFKWAASTPGRAAASVIDRGDLEGDDVFYGSQAGRGTLYVNDWWISPSSQRGRGSSMAAAIQHLWLWQSVDSEPSNCGDLGGGTIPVEPPIGGQQNLGTPNSVQVINDGLITGTGRITTGVFRNRYLGRVRVDAGQSLVIDSSGDFSTATGVTSIEPVSNYGTIEVLGNSQAQAQIEFVRSPSESTTTTAVRPFVNLPLVSDRSDNTAFALIWRRPYLSPIRESTVRLRTAKPKYVRLHRRHE